jgi:hypothetical protein
MRQNTITFANGNRAVIVTVTCDENAKAIIHALGITSPRALILLFGGAAGLDDSRNADLVTLIADGIIPAAVELDALIIDGGTQSGVMAIMGEAVARYPGTCELLGIAPARKVTYPGSQNEASAADGAPLEPNHSHFVLVQSDKWGGETAKLLELARTFSAPTVAILVNGGAIAVDEALQSVRNGWPLLVIQGSGRLADELGAAVRDSQSAKSIEVSEIVRSGRVALFHVEEGPEKLRDQLRGMLRGEGTIKRHDQPSTQQRRG